MQQALLAIQKAVYSLKNFNPAWRLAAVAASLSVASVSAQAPLDIRVALIIGNSAYVGAPLDNPANDAKAMSEVLRTLGFQVIELRDGSKEQMIAAIAKASDTLKGKQGVGMLYYAGHGLQLDWHNYMVPVDAKLKVPQDVPLQTIDLGSVINTFKKAGNRMNIMVLDACRDNPFAGGTSSAKGLAQLDAPSGTFLAYATAPGNVAEDGNEKGGNGLYTQYLLQELKRPTAKIEDVFKRVRLNVRRQSEGRQIPWESTSLEDDFYFNDGVKFTMKPDGKEAVAAAPLPAAPKKLSKEEAQELEFQEQKAAWDKVKGSASADDFYAFLQQYPTAAQFSELAQFRLDQLAKPKIQAAVGQGQDASLGYTGPRFKVGDEFRVQVSDSLTNVLQRTFTTRVTSIQGDLVNFNEGITVYTMQGAFVKGNNATSDPPQLISPVEFQVGKKLKWRSAQLYSNGTVGELQGNGQVVRRETITVPAGVFQTYLVEHTVFSNLGIRTIAKYWFDPRYGIPIRFERFARAPYSFGPLESMRQEVVSIKAERS